MIMKNTIIIVFTSSIIFISILFLVFASPGFYNNFLLYRFINSIDTMYISKKTTLIESKSFMGVLWGVGNHCDMEIISSFDSDKTPFSFYDDVLKLRSIKFPFSNNNVPKIFYYADNLSLINNNKIYEYNITNNTFYGLEIDYFLERWELDYINKLKNINLNRNIYIIIASDQVYEGLSMIDLRCY